jgi:hypothetical protein
VLIEKDNAADHGFNRWTLNGVAFDSKTMPVSRRLVDYGFMSLFATT